MVSIYLAVAYAHYKFSDDRVYKDRWYGPGFYNGYYSDHFFEDCEVVPATWRAGHVAVVREQRVEERLGRTSTIPRNSVWIWGFEPPKPKSPPCRSTDFANIFRGPPDPDEAPTTRLIS